MDPLCTALHHLQTLHSLTKYPVYLHGALSENCCGVLHVSRPCIGTGPPLLCLLHTTPLHVGILGIPICKSSESNHRKPFTETLWDSMGSGGGRGGAIATMNCCGDCFYYKGDQPKFRFRVRGVYGLRPRPHPRRCARFAVHACS